MKSNIVLTTSDFYNVDEIQKEKDENDFNSETLLSKTIETFENEIDEKFIRCLLDKDN